MSDPGRSIQIDFRPDICNSFLEKNQFDSPRMSDPGGSIQIEFRPYITTDFYDESIWLI